MVLLSCLEVRNMRVTTKGQVTIPRKIREVLGITPETNVEFVEENGKFYLVKASEPKPTGKFRRLRGIATTQMSTDEIMSLTRESE
jgi:antitoxin PrlF